MSLEIGYNAVLIQEKNGGGGGWTPRVNSKLHKGGREKISPKHKRSFFCEGLSRGNKTWTCSHSNIQLIHCWEHTERARLKESWVVRVAQLLNIPNTKMSLPWEIGHSHTIFHHIYRNWVHWSQSLLPKTLLIYRIKKKKKKKPEWQVTLTPYSPFWNKRNRDIRLKFWQWLSRVKLNMCRSKYANQSHIIPFYFYHTTPNHM